MLYGLNVLNNNEKLLLYKYLYKNDKDYYSQDEIAPDDEYEYIKNLVDPNSPEYKIPWDEVTLDDVKSVLDKVGIRYPLFPQPNENELNDLQEELVSNWKKSRSIIMVETGEEVKSYFDGTAEYVDKSKYNYLAMLKLDGWNIQLYYITGKTKPVLVTTRGRGGNTVNCTGVLADLMPPLNVNEETLISGELVLDKKILTSLRVKYGRPFKNSRNSISSIIHNTIDVNSIKDHIRVYAFDIQTKSGTRYSNRYETLSILDSIGFYTPPRLLMVDFSTDFYSTFHKMQNYYAENFTNNWECDGVVIAPVEYNEYNEKNEMYQDDFIAIKMGIWSKKLYHGVVEDIICPPSSGGAYRELIALISPTETVDGRTIRRVPLINLRRAKCGVGEKPVDIGDEIIFSYHSKQVVKFRGKDGKVFF